MHMHSSRQVAVPKPLPSPTVVDFERDLEQLADRFLAAQVKMDQERRLREESRPATCRFRVVMPPFWR
jgi:hypothetical protein